VADERPPCSPEENSPREPCVPQWEVGVRWRLLIPVAIIAVVLCLVLAAWLPSRRSESRPNPLANPIRIVGISSAGLELADGRTLRPAAVALPEDPEAHSAALEFIHIAVAQGVEVIRELEDGSALLLCEPRFYNWCGTCRTRAWYLRSGLSELLIRAGHASPVLPWPGLDPAEAQRIETVTAMAEVSRHGEPETVRPGIGIRYDSHYRDLERLDELAELYAGLR
jgi:hypothetical protein